MIGVGVDRPMESEQRGWNLGYLAGEAERIELATANVDLRSDIAVWRNIAARLGEALEALIDSPHSDGALQVDDRDLDFADRALAFRIEQLERLGNGHT